MSEFTRYCLGTTRKDTALLIGLYGAMVGMSYVHSGVEGLYTSGLFSVAIFLFSVVCFATRRTDTN